jgi:hypothetical protein
MTRRVYDVLTCVIYEEVVTKRQGIKNREVSVLFLSFKTLV